MLEFDYTEVEKQTSDALEYHRELYEEVMEFKQMEFYSPKNELRRKYSYMEPNREFSGNFELQKFKKVDDGTFVDNGYR